MTVNKLNRILIGIVILSFLIFFSLLNMKAYQKYPQIYSPSELPEEVLPEEVNTSTIQFPTSTY
ncbi:MAG: hypothetical protein C4278_00270 [Patescibacteria group bacterium]